MKRLVVQNPALDERGNIDEAIRHLQEWGVLEGRGDCNHASFEALRKVVHAHFNIPWTSITPAMERLLYAISAVNRPRNVVAVGIFCGNTLIWNVGPACGPGKCYAAQRLIGIEVKPDRAGMARDNLRAIGVTDSVQVIAGDGHEILRQIDYPIHLLYLDCDCPYKPMLDAAYDKVPQGGLVIAHNTLHKGWLKEKTSHEYLAHVRDPAVFRESVSVEPDDLGIEVSMK
ncbi:MAG: class I SAM-dependent methyltransferase [Planctomycetota bacterium]